MEINENSTWKQMTKAGNIYDAGNSEKIKTSDWRTIRPEYIPENCKQCGLCFPVCPDDAIPVGQDMKRKDFNLDKCKGCGICAKVCPFKAIVMKEEEK